jgi:error-prone DNA polymerase
MGFWSPQSLVADARRHGVAVRRPHVNRSEVGASLECDDEGGRACPVLRLGLGSVRGVGEATAERIVSGRPWAGGEDLVRRAGVSRAQLETLAAAGALDTGERATAASRRRLLWAAGAAAQGTPDRLPGIVVGVEAPPLPEPTLYDSVGDDLWALGLAPERTAMHLARERLEAMGVVVASALLACTDGDRVTVAGVVTHRQHPETARGAVFVNLEDETGHVNVVFSRGAWARWKPVALYAPVLLIRGRLQLGQGTVSLTAERVEALSVGTAVPASRDFR